MHGEDKKKVGSQGLPGPDVLAEVFQCSKLITSWACLEYLEEALEWAAECKHFHICTVADKGEP
jgi:hypothetical protein